MKTIEKIRAFALGLAPWVIGATIILGITVVLPKLSYNYANSKAIIPEIGMAFVILLGLVGVPWASFKKIFSSKIVWGVSAFIIVSLIATFASIDPALSWFSHLERGMGMFYLIVIVVGSLFSILITYVTGTFRKAVLYPISIAGAIIALSTVFGSSGLGLLKGVIVLSDAAKGGGLTGNSSYAGTIIMMTFFITVYLFVTTKDVWKKRMLGAFAVFSIISPNILNLLSYQVFHFGLHGIFDLVGEAKGATISLVLGLAVSLGIFLAYSKNKARAWGGKILVGGVFAVVLAGMIMLAIPKSPVYKAFVQSTKSARFVYWGLGVDSFKDHPLIGTGPETYRYANERYFDPKILRPSYGEEIWADKPHNAYLEVLVTTGILGIIAYAMMIACLIWVLIRLGKNSENKKLVALFSGFLFAYLLNNFILFDIPSSYLMLFLAIFWLAAEEVSGASGALRDPKGALADPNTAISSTNFILRSVAGLAVVVIIFSVVIPHIKKLHLVLGEMFAPIETRIGLYQQAEGASVFGSGLSLGMRADVYSQTYMNHIGELANAPDADKKLILADIDTLSGVLMKSFEKYPESTQALIALGRLGSIKVAVLGTADQSALAQMTYAGSEVVRLSPRNVQGYWILGQVEIYRQKYGEALRLFTQALDIDRKVPTSHMVIVNLAKLTGNKKLLDKATAEFERDVEDVDKKQWLNGLTDPTQ